MAIHARRTGLLIAGVLLSETDTYWIFQARDNKYETKVPKGDSKGAIFDGDNALNWIHAQRKKGGK